MGKEWDGLCISFYKNCSNFFLKLKKNLNTEGAGFIGETLRSVLMDYVKEFNLIREKNAQDKSSLSAKTRRFKKTDFHKNLFIKLKHNFPDEAFLRGVQRLAKKAFDRLLLEAIDDAFSSLGDSAKQSIYFHLETKFKVAKTNIPDQLEGFEEGLEKIFGAGSRFLEILIMKKLYEKIGQPLEWNESKELVFIDYVKAAQQSFSKKEDKPTLNN